jgi:hypothetical protein
MSFGRETYIHPDRRGQLPLPKVPPEIRKMIHDQLPNDGEFVHFRFDGPNGEARYMNSERVARQCDTSTFYRFECPQVYKHLCLTSDEEIRALCFDPVTDELPPQVLSPDIRYCLDRHEKRVKDREFYFSMLINGKEAYLRLRPSADYFFLDGFIHLTTRKLGRLDRTTNEIALHTKVPEDVTGQFYRIGYPVLRLDDLFQGFWDLDNRPDEEKGRPRSLEQRRELVWLESMAKMFDNLSDNAALHVKFVILVGDWVEGRVPADLVTITEADDVNDIYPGPSPSEDLTERSGLSKNSRRQSKVCEESSAEAQRLRQRTWEKICFVRQQFEDYKLGRRDVAWQWLGEMKRHPEILGDSVLGDRAEAFTWLSYHKPLYNPEVSSPVADPYPLAEQAPFTITHQQRWADWHQALYWLQSPEGQEWLHEECDASYFWLRIFWGRHWLLETAAGQAYLRTDSGRRWQRECGDERIPPAPAAHADPGVIVRFLIPGWHDGWWQAGRWHEKGTIAPRAWRFVKFPVFKRKPRGEEEYPREAREAAASTGT